MDIEKYRTGISHIDTEHLLLIETARQIRVCSIIGNYDRQKLDDHIEIFLRWSRWHLANEEKYLSANIKWSNIKDLRHKAEIKLKFILLCPEARDLPERLENWLESILSLDKESLPPEEDS